MRVLSISVVSHQNGDDQTIRERRVFLGYFDVNINSKDIEEALTENNLWSRVLTSDSFAGGSFYALSLIPIVISEGVIFDKTDEFIECLKKGLTYDDIAEGYSIVSGD